MDAHVLYPAMSRDRDRADLWLALEPLETDADRARHGTPRTEAEARQRAVDAYAGAIENDRPDSLVLAELGEQPQPIIPTPAREEADQTRRAEIARREQEQAGGVEHTPTGAHPGPSWRDRPHGSVLDSELPARIAATEREAVRHAAAADRLTAHIEQIRAAAAAGDGPAMRELQSLPLPILSQIEDRSVIREAWRAKQPVASPWPPSRLEGNRRGQPQASGGRVRDPARRAARRRRGPSWPRR